MRQQGVGEFMDPHIRCLIRVLGALQQRQFHPVIFDTVSIFTVIQEGNAVIRFGQVGPLMPDHLEPRLIPAGIPMCGTVQISILNIIGGLCAAHIYGKGCFQQPMILLPVHACLKINPAGKAVKNHILGNPGISVGILERKDCTKRPLFF